MGPYVWSWFQGVLRYLGLQNKEAKILFLGLNNAGKTTLMHVLRDDRVVQHQPTQYPTSEEIQLGGINFKAFDLGGHKLVRKVWKDYFMKVGAIVFLVDASAPHRFPEAKLELDGLLSDDQLSTVPFLILGNKIDTPTAASEDELRNGLGLTYTTGKQSVHEWRWPWQQRRPQGASAGAQQQQQRPCEVFMCSVIRRMGYGEGFRWLSQYIE